MLLYYLKEVYSKSLNVEKQRNNYKPAKYMCPCTNFSIFVIFKLIKFFSDFGCGDQLFL